MRLSFDTVEELRAFVKEDLKAKRTGKGEADEGAVAGNAPAPLQPPAGGGALGSTGAGFNPQAFNPGAGFPGTVTTGPAPEVMALVHRIVTKLDASIASGQSAEQALSWFRGQCGPEAAQATMDQIKGVFLPRLTHAALDQIAKLMAA